MRFLQLWSKHPKHKDTCWEMELCSNIACYQGNIGLLRQTTLCLCAHSLLCHILRWTFLRIWKNKSKMIEFKRHLKNTSLPFTEIMHYFKQWLIQTVATRECCSSQNRIHFFLKGSRAAKWSTIAKTCYTLLKLNALQHIQRLNWIKPLFWKMHAYKHTHAGHANSTQK